ncbi:MAG: hypothetical protein HPY76_08755 [Anaerolineae bacterium]|nr:hypothetical protein [Anaerolineae bacterium]
MIKRFFTQIKSIFPDWLKDPYVLGTFVVVLLFIAFLAWGPVLQDPRAMMNGETGAPSATPLPEEWQRSSELTNGIVFMGGIIILIIVGSTLGVMRSRNR